NSTGPDPEVVQEMSCNVAAGVGPPGGPGDSFEVPAPTGTVWVGGCEIGALAQDATLTIAHVSGTCLAQLTPEAVFEIGTAYPADTVFEFLCDMTTPPNTTLHIAFSA
ncbi:MAG: hypothetical protein QOJ26_1605, partial [Thermoplasmata archaeon]|nr:hypothetical protein [Thermoplasmata archaeon]